ncbi:TIGR03808 family TAT-translocated repetitive protein [Rhizobium sp. S-51]|uniref:TIGR03808 family TAT-translocated repetitive protein n=1 Tax=Rhizobium terricola TaxID=2728849 RepID=A0A7Y0FW15_9HYPH|nr:TIGR03808 family TAT-translocated repetitive protein [Rhizobium terricola]NML74415.1 TIGR03808 family TAT-translocated repetitive protein [Rhizobium terricola]
MLKRRVFLGGLASFSAIGRAAADGADASLQPIAADLRGALDAQSAGVVPGASDNQSRKLQALLDAAAASGQPVFLPAGTYEVSNLDLPDGTRLSGVPGATRLAYGGDGHLVSAREARHISISGITLDGANRWLGDYADALIGFRGVDEVLITDCEIVGSRKHGLQLERSGGRISGCRITGAANAGLMAIETKALAIRDNDVSDCGNGGILVHRWTKGEDGAMVTGNRVSRIGAKDGGTGQNGNGINLFRADNVMVSGNHVSACAFSAIRANSASNATISGNQCFSSGETAIYAEFSFEGALIADNLVDGAANGILVVNLDQGGRLSTVSGNIVRNLKREGPYVHDGAGFGFGIAVEADTVVTGNVVENAPKWGLMLGWGPYLRNVVASANIIRRAPVGIAVSVVDGAGAALISGNLFSETTDGAIVGFRWNDKATGELIDGGDAFDHLTIAGNRHG